MNINNWKNEITEHLTQSLEKCSPNHKFAEVLKYSVLPPGKVFRPLLVYSMAQDLDQISQSHKYFASSLEIHHTYTLIHDDLPAMDDDDYRRGRLASHKKFSESNAILAGDALINMSYELLALVDTKYLSQLITLYSKMLGANGLILGQVLDLEINDKDLNKILRIHELKTARLIQLALIGSAILSDREDLTPICEKLGLALGINFQLLDDLCELTDIVEGHELDINPFLKFDAQKIMQTIEQNNKDMQKVINTHKLENLRNYINHYLEKSKNKILIGIDNIQQQTGLNLNQIEINLL